MKITNFILKYCFACR